MSPLRYYSAGKGTGKRQSHVPPMSGAKLQVHAATGAARTSFPHYPFQPLPPPNGPAPYRFDLSQLVTADDYNQIKNAPSMVFHTVGDTGDHRGQQQDFVAEMMTQDAQSLPDGKKPAFFYHLGDIVYFAGDIDMYGANFYETYKDYPGFIVAIPGNHDCQPDDPLDGPVNPNKVPLDGFVQNFMSKNPGQPGSLKTGSSRTQMNLPNVFWTFTTPHATIVGLFSNVGETEGEFHQDQITWFQGEVRAADPNLPLIVTVHHPPFSGDVEHSGSSVVDTMLSQSFQAARRYPNLILSGHVHNYQRFTNVVQGAPGQKQVACVVAGAGGYTKLGKLQKIGGAYPDPSRPLQVAPDLTLERYDHDNYGFLRVEVSKSQITGTYTSAPYSVGTTPSGSVVESFKIDVPNFAVTTVGGGIPAGGGKGGGKGGRGKGGGGKGGKGKVPKPKPTKKKRP